MAQKTSKTVSSPAAKPEHKPGSPFPFQLGKVQYIWIVSGILLILIGGILMYGGGSEDPNVFPKEEIYSFRRITLAPAMILLGFALPFVALLKRFSSAQ